jgi:hypothetical protein
MVYTVEQKNRNVAMVTVPYDRKFEQKFLLTADRHWDNPHSDQRLQKRHLDLAKRYGAGVIDIGDLFCAMQGKYDKRSRKEDLRPEHKVNDYLDALVSTATDFFAPYAENIITLGMGNHETSVLDKHETNLTSNLVTSLNHRMKTKIYNGGYSGWVIFRFLNKRTGHEHFKKLWYIHGYGGGGPVTRDVIQSNRKAVYLPDADVVISGHTHDEWMLPIVRARITDNGDQYLHEQMHVKIPTYKDEYNNGFDGFHIEKGRPPKPIGAIWMKFHKESITSKIEVDFSKAR